MKSESQFLSLAQARPAAPRLLSNGKGRPASGNTALAAQDPPPGESPKIRKTLLKHPPGWTAAPLIFDKSSGSTACLNIF